MRDFDCTLPERCYCAEFNTKCTPAAADEVADKQAFTLESIAPNPFDETTSLRFTLPAAGRVRLQVFSAIGHKLDEAELGWLPAGEQQFAWTKKADTTSGICFFMLYFENGNQAISAVKKALILPR